MVNVIVSVKDLGAFTVSAGRVYGIPANVNAIIHDASRSHVRVCLPLFGYYCRVYHSIPTLGGSEIFNAVAACMARMTALHQAPQ